MPVSSYFPTSSSTLFIGCFRSFLIWDNKSFSVVFAYFSLAWNPFVCFYSLLSALFHTHGSCFYWIIVYINFYLFILRTVTLSHELQTFFFNSFSFTFLFDFWFWIPQKMFLFFCNQIFHFNLLGLLALCHIRKHCPALRLLASLES